MSNVEKLSRKLRGGLYAEVVILVAMYTLTHIVGKLFGHSNQVSWFAGFSFLLLTIIALIILIVEEALIYQAKKRVPDIFNVDSELKQVVLVYNIAKIIIIFVALIIIPALSGYVLGWFPTK